MELKLFSDAQLMTLFAHGREDAFRLLYDRNRERVHRLALRMTGRAQDAEEIVQETFLRVARAAPRYEAQAAFTTWLHRVALNVCLTWLKRAEGNVVPLFAADAAPVAAGATPHAALEAREGAALLQEELLSLSAPLRSAFVLRICEGLPYAEVAAILEIPEATARTHVHRARSALRHRMRRALSASRHQGSAR